MHCAWDTAKILEDCHQNAPVDNLLTWTMHSTAKKGGFVIIRHNNIRDFEASLLSEIVRDVETEPTPQPVDGERLNGLVGDNAKPDVRARGVWRPGQNAYFDVRITNSNSTTQVNTPTLKTLEKHEKWKIKEKSIQPSSHQHWAWHLHPISFLGYGCDG